MSTASKNKVLALFGPTGTGKTALLTRLFAGPERLINQDIGLVSADSIQIYRGLSIGSAKPEPEVLAAFPHHLIDILEPAQCFSLGDFVEQADEACEACLMRGLLPVLSGGTAYYIKAFIYGLPTAPPADEAIRQCLRAELESRGPEPLREELAAVDPVSHARIAPADHYRLLRALEVYRASGRPLSAFALPTEPRTRWQVSCVALDRSRDELYDRINARVRQMFDSGLPAEVARLRRSGCTAETPAMKGIGYAEFFDPALANLPEAERLTRIEQAIAQHSRNYAKRQLTFMRALPGVRWLPAGEPESIARLLCQELDLDAAPGLSGLSQSGDSHASA